jgi:hypothetical protein
MENRGRVIMAISRKEAIKNILGQIPFTAELYWLVRQRGRPVHSRFSLKGLQDHLPEINAQALELRQRAQPGKKVFIFAALHYWIEHAALLGAALSAQGHQVSLGFLPYSDWQSTINLFDLRRQNAYARKVIGQMSDLLEPISFLNLNKPYFALPDVVNDFIRQVTIYDTQYTLQDEDVEFESKIYRFRLDRNETFARQALSYLEAERPDIVIVPNGTIIEHGVIYRLARYLRIPVVTYEFGDQRKRIWIAKDAEVMRQETDALWEARRSTPLVESELDQIRSMFAARQRADLWANFARRWQDAPAQGGDNARAELGLDERPVVLLATNVLGDSLTLGRQIFSQSMVEWISRTVQYFAGRPDVQLVIRVHPGEVLTHGLSMEKVVHQVLPKLPEHIHLIGAKEKVNTYDLIEVADLGLVYTTTVGMEMALCGLPVIVSGATHYRERGFTKDPDSWVEYFKVLGQILSNPIKYRLTRETVDLAWRYAYRFFFEYPRPFPWHLVRMWDDYKNHPLNSVFSEEGLDLYGDTFRSLVGESIKWNHI